MFRGDSTDRNNTELLDVLNDNLPNGWSSRYDQYGTLFIEAPNEYHEYLIERNSWGSSEINKYLKRDYPDVSCTVYLLLSDIFFMFMPIYLFSANPTLWQRVKKFFYIGGLTHEEKYNLRYLKTMCG